MVPSTFSRLKAARALPVILAALIFAGCGTQAPDQSAAHMQGTAQADSGFYLQQMQQSSDDSKTNWQLLAIRALLKEGKSQHAIELFNQLPQNLNDAQRREQSLLAVEIKTGAERYRRRAGCCWKNSLRLIWIRTNRRVTGRRKLMPARAALLFHCCAR